jgi:hypothetical protein
MNYRPPLTLFFVSAFSSAVAADRLSITVENDLAAARPGEVIVVPWTEVSSRLTGLVFNQVVVKDAAGHVVPSQVTAFHHVHKGPQVYDDLIFQHDFSVGEKSAVFTVEKLATPEPPLPSRVMARVVPERFDDFGWENDRMAHRAYGPGLELPSATKDQMTSSGLDFWCKRVRYLVVDGWYHKGHDGLHTDTGEGLDMYDVGTYRGLGGTGVWDGQELHVSRNWRTWKIFANGPLRAVFELGYEPWDAGNVWDSGNGVMVSETKHFVVDAGRNLDLIESTFDFKAAKGSSGEITVAIGLTKHPKKASGIPSRDEKTGWLGLWEEFRDPVDGNLGTGIVLDPSAKFAGFAETPNDLLILVKVKPGETVRYYAGGGWDKSGDFATSADWNKYLDDFAARLRSPLHLAYAVAP